MSTEDTIRQAYLAHRREHGIPAALKIVRDVAGVESLDDVVPERRQALIDAFTDAKPEGAFDGVKALMNRDGTVNGDAIMNKWNATGRGRGRGRGEA